MERVWVVGSSGAGKSTLASALSARLDLPYTELDRLFWRRGWQQMPDDIFRDKVDATVGSPRWVICGNYSLAREVILSRVDTIVWLDYPLPFIFGRLFRRTIARILTRDDLWGSGNRETWRRAFFSRDLLLLYAARTAAEP
jgi:adenylate kinase family enzyme